MLQPVVFPVIPLQVHPQLIIVRSRNLNVEGLHLVVVFADVRIGRLLRSDGLVVPFYLELLFDAVIGSKDKGECASGQSDIVVFNGVVELSLDDEMADPVGTVVDCNRVGQQQDHSLRLGENVDSACAPNQHSVMIENESRVLGIADDGHFRHGCLVARCVAKHAGKLCSRPANGVTLFAKARCRADAAAE